MLRDDSLLNTYWCLLDNEYYTTTNVVLYVYAKLSAMMPTLTYWKHYVCNLVEHVQLF